MIEDVRALLFDVFGTVVDWRGSLITELSVFGAARELHADWTGLVDAWRAAYVPSMDRVRRGALPWTNLDDLHRTALDELAPRFGLEALDDGVRDHLVRAWHRLHPWPDAVEGLTRLKRRFVIATLSNGNVALLVNMAKHADLPWDTVLSAELFRHYKPDAETYLGAAALLGLAPAQVMMCAAHNSDLRAARALGLRTAFVVRPTEYGAAQTKDLAAEEAWDVIAGNIATLAAQLGC